MGKGHLSIDVLYTNPKTIWSVMWCTATLCCLVTLAVVQSHKRRHARLHAEIMPKYGKRCGRVRVRVRVGVMARLAVRINKDGGEDGLLMTHKP